MMRELTETEMSQVSGGFSLPSRFEFGATRPIININICDHLPGLSLCSDTLEGLLGGHRRAPPPAQSSPPSSPTDPVVPVQLVPDITTQPSPSTPDTTSFDIPDFDFSGLFGREDGRLTIFGFGRF
jgi:bacteriocin-like protein